MTEAEKPIREIVKDKSWQKLRESLVGTWKKTPGKNVKKLRAWLGPINKASMDKLRIIMNYLTGTAFRTGRIKHPTIQKLRDDVSKEMKRRKKQKLMEQGKMNTQEQAGYKGQAPSSGKMCAKCKYFINARKTGSSLCKVVLGDISPLGTCKFFSAITYEKALMEVANSTEVTPAMVDWFNRRTSMHIALVQKYCQKIYDLDPKKFKGLIERGLKHDASKFREPEYTPYLYLTWKYKCNLEEKPYVIPNHILKETQEATMFHIKRNRHHPEFHCPPGQAKINTKNRHKPPEGTVIDATKMSILDIAEMCADWMAMSEELGDHPKNWADQNVNVRWKFTPAQTKLIYTFVEKVYAKPIKKQCIEDAVDLSKKFVYLYHGTDTRLVKSIKKEGLQTKYMGEYVKHLPVDLNGQKVIFFTSNPKSAKFYSEMKTPGKGFLGLQAGDTVVLKVKLDTRYVVFLGKSGEFDEFYYTKDVPAKDIEVIESNKINLQEGKGFVRSRKHTKSEANYKPKAKERFCHSCNSYIKENACNQVEGYIELTGSCRLYQENNIISETEEVKHGFVSDIETETLNNTFFRKVLFTARFSQLVLMNIKPGDDIGEEIHNDGDQFIRIEAGIGKLFINDKEFDVGDGFATVIPRGVKHNIVNVSKTEDLKLYSIYCPPHHPSDTIHETKEQADKEEKHSNYKLIEASEYGEQPNYQNMKKNAPTFAYEAVYGKLPKKYLSSRINHPAKACELPNGAVITIDKEIDCQWIIELNNIPNIETRSSCGGHGPDRPTFIIFRMIPTLDRISSKISNSLNKINGLYSLCEIGQEGRPRIVVAGKTWIGKANWEQWWHLALTSITKVTETIKKFHFESKIKRNNYIVPQSMTLNQWKKYKDKHKDIKGPKDYHEKYPKAKWKVVHGNKKGEIGKALPGGSNLSYNEAVKMHSAIVISKKGGKDR